MKIVSISGPVAAGKTTLLSKLMEALGSRAQAHVERPQDNPFIRSYYSDSKRWSFHSQVTFLTQYFDDTGWLRPTQDFYLFDRCLVENLVIARYRLEQGDLTEDEFAVLQKLAHGIEKLMPPVDKYLYLDCPVDLLLEHAHQRGRDYEASIDRSYCEKQKALYDAWAATLPRERVMVIDKTRPLDMPEILAFLEA